MSDFTCTLYFVKNPSQAELDGERMPQSKLTERTLYKTVTVKSDSRLLDQLPYDEEVEAEVPHGFDLVIERESPNSDGRIWRDAALSKKSGETEWHCSYPLVDSNVYPHGDVSLACFLVPNDYVKLVKFGTLSQMFSKYKELSDEQLDERLAGISIGGDYVIPAASATTLGGVKAGSNVTIAADGTISVAAPYALPAATSSTRGGIKVGYGLAISADGTLSAAFSGASASELPRDFVRRTIETKVEGVECVRFFIASTSGDALNAGNYGTVWQLATQDTKEPMLLDDGEVIVPSTSTSSFVSVPKTTLADLDNIVIVRSIDEEWRVTGMCTESWHGLENKPFDSVDESLVTNDILDLAQLRSHLADCINGVVLYDDEKLAERLYDVTVDGVDVGKYARFTVYVECINGTQERFRYSKQSVSVSEEEIATISRANASLIKAFSICIDSKKGEQYGFDVLYFTYADFDNKSGICVSCTLEEKGLLLSSDGNALGTSGACAITRIVGYPKFTGVA